MLILDPENNEAATGLNALLNVASQPTPLPPTPTAQPASTPTSLNTLALTWADAQALHSAGRWEEAIDRLRQVRAADATFESDEIDDLLFTAYVNIATQKSNAGSLEEAVTFFDRALEIHPDASDVRAQRVTTAEYVDALTYWYADRPKVIELLSNLYQNTPAYRDVRQRLQRAHLEYADSLSRQSDWCAAADQYTAAIAVQSGPGLEEKQSESQVLCEEAPLPVAEESAGIPVDPSETPAPPPVLTSGLGTGRILYSARDVTDGRYRIYAQPVTASVRPVLLVEDAMQPALPRRRPAPCLSEHGQCQPRAGQF